MTKEEAIARVKHQRDWANEVNRMLDVEAFDMAIKALEQEPSKGSSYIQAIYTEALEEGIRCAMCTNTIKSDTGCDGGCIVDAKMYNKVMTEINSRLLRQPPVTPQEHRWIPMVRREPTDEEKAEYLAQYGEELCYMLENEMPLGGQEVLVSIGEFVSEDVFDENFYNFENQDIENVDAWMPLPEPYKGGQEE